MAATPLRPPAFPNDTCVTQAFEYLGDEALRIALTGRIRPQREPFSQGLFGNLTQATGIAHTGVESFAQHAGCTRGIHVVL